MWNDKPTAMILSVSVFLTACGSQDPDALQTASLCPDPASIRAEQLSEEDGVQQYRLEIETAAAWLAEASQPFNETIRSYHDYIRSNTDADQIGLLKRQQKVFQQVNGIGPREEISQRYHDVINGNIGTLMKASCLDQYMVSESLDRIDPRENLVEMSAHVFQKNDRLIAHVAWRTVFEPSIMAPRVALDNQTKNSLIDDGWKYLYFIHSHPFFFDNKYGDIAGTVMPSAGDINTYIDMTENYPETYGRITNGFDTGMYSKDDARALFVEGHH